MSSLDTLTGRTGKVSLENLEDSTESLVARITQWAVNPTLATSSEWGDSDSAGYTNRASGRRDATFDTEGKYDTTDEVYQLFNPGDTLRVTLWLKEDLEVTPNVSLYWDFPRALCNDFQLTVNVDTEEVIGWTAAWGADGIFYRPGQTDQPSRTLPDPS